MPGAGWVAAIYWAQSSHPVCTLNSYKTILHKREGSSERARRLCRAGHRGICAPPRLRPCCTERLGRMAESPIAGENGPADEEVRAADEAPALEQAAAPDAAGDVSGADETEKDDAQKQHGDGDTPVAGDSSAGGRRGAGALGRWGTV